jgi:fructose-1,6-bisphosphatase/inositol monophosphatase family enzyme
MGIAGDDFVTRMALPVRQSMAAVRWLEGRVENQPKLDEDSAAKAALTDADCVSQEILLTALRAYYPWVRVDAEENTPAAKTFAANDSPYTVVIDPVDGTLRYLRRDGLYAILVGLEHEGRVEAALVALPQLDLLFRAVRGGGVQVARGGGEFERARPEAGGDRVIISPNLTASMRERLRELGFSPVLGAGGAIAVAALLPATHGGLRLAPGEQGLSRRAWVALLPALEAGCAVEALDGGFPELFRPGVSGLRVAANPAALARLR